MPRVHFFKNKYKCHVCILKLVVRWLLLIVLWWWLEGGGGGAVEELGEEVGENAEEEEAHVLQFFIPFFCILQIHVAFVFIFQKKRTRGILLTAMCALTKSKLARGVKTTKRVILRELVCILFC